MILTVCNTSTELWNTMELFIVSRDAFVFLIRCFNSNVLSCESVTRGAMAACIDVSTFHLPKPIFFPRKPSWKVSKLSNGCWDRCVYPKVTGKGTAAIENLQDVYVLYIHLHCVHTSTMHYTYISLYIYIHTHTYIYIYTCIHIYIYAFANVPVYTQWNTGDFCAQVADDVPLFLALLKDLFPKASWCLSSAAVLGCRVAHQSQIWVVCIQSIYIYIHIYIHIYIYILYKYIHIIYINMRVYIYTYTYVYTYPYFRHIHIWHGIPLVFPSSAKLSPPLSSGSFRQVTDPPKKVYKNVEDGSRVAASVLVRLRSLAGKRVEMINFGFIIVILIMMFYSFCCYYCCIIFIYYNPFPLILNAPPLLINTSGSF